MMYSFIFRKMLIGPVWLKILEAIILVAGITFVLFNYGFPAIAPYMPLNSDPIL